MVYIVVMQTPNTVKYFVVSVSLGFAIFPHAYNKVINSIKHAY